mmetsp:Transcript_32055/g.62694  ORF Transcript_32055/g.62694 Transcript_32055/m.62694 type:complete len:330 (+) Transcript_32055:879-1868(+)
MTWMEQTNFFNWKPYLSSKHTNTFHKDVHGNLVEIHKAVWFNFGIGEDTSAERRPNGTYPLRAHPDEVWIRFSLDPLEPWTRIRSWLKPTAEPSTPVTPPQSQESQERDAAHNLAQFSHGQPPINVPKPLSLLYTSAVKVSLKKARDLAELAKYVPEDVQPFYKSIAHLPPTSELEEVVTDTEPTVDSDDAWASGQEDGSSRSVTAASIAAAALAAALEDAARRDSTTPVTAPPTPTIMSDRPAIVATSTASTTTQRQSITSLALPSELSYAIPPIPQSPLVALAVSSSMAHPTSPLASSQIESSSARASTDVEMFLPSTQLAMDVTLN